MSTAAALAKAKSRDGKPLIWRDKLAQIRRNGEEPRVFANFALGEHTITLTSK